MARSKYTIGFFAGAQLVHSQEIADTFANAKVFMMSQFGLHKERSDATHAEVRDDVDRLVYRYPRLERP